MGLPDALSEELWDSVESALSEADCSALKDAVEDALGCSEALLLLLPEGPGLTLGLGAAL